ncbi:hypothetical protein ABTN27_20655, partial [Acinetobacter baumannii]
MIQDRNVELDAKLVKEWKAGYDAANKFQLEERRRATYQERFVGLQAIWRQAAFLGIKPSESYDLSVNDIW